MAGSAPNASCYKLIRRLSSGEMAEVWLARMVCVGGVEKTVVVKRLASQFATDARMRAAFLLEANLVARMNHQNIVQLYDVGDSGDGLFVIMEYIDGHSLRTILAALTQARKVVPVAIAIQIATAVAAALDYVHGLADEKGQSLEVVHRDISPSNIVLSQHGGVKLVDFGIAKAALDSEQTQLGTVKGKSAYMSPEQCVQGALDGRSDLFSLGVVFYEMTTGATPFATARDGHQTIMEKIVVGRCLPPSARRREYPRDLERIVMRALAPARELRYKSVEAFGRALAEFAQASGMAASALFLRDFFLGVTDDLAGANPAEAPKSTSRPVARPAGSAAANGAIASASLDMAAELDSTQVDDVGLDVDDYIDPTFAEPIAEIPTLVTSLPTKTSISSD